MAYLYQVGKRYANGSLDNGVAGFKKINDAKLFIEASLQADARLKVKVTYQLMEGMDMVEEFSEAPAESGSASTQQRSSFQPNPFNATPRPPGMPPKWVKDDNDKK